MSPPNYIGAHQHSSFHRKEVEASELCGCFYCLAVYRPSEITWWVDGEKTAVCPHCTIDSVIGSASGYPITHEFLTRMNEHWFETSVSTNSEE